MDKKMRPFSSARNLNKFSSGLGITNDQQRHKSPCGHEFHSKEELYYLVLTLKKFVNDLTEDNKKLKTQLAALHSKSSKIYQSSKLSNFSPETSKKALISSSYTLQLENKYLKKELYSQKKLIKELLKYPHPQYTEIFESYKSQSKSLKTLYKNLQSHSALQKTTLSKNSLAQRSVLPKYYTQTELLTISQIKKQIKENAEINQLELDEIWFVMNPNDLEFITFNEFLNGARGLNIRNPDSELDLYFRCISHKGKLFKGGLIDGLT